MPPHRPAPRRRPPSKIGCSSEAPIANVAVGAFRKLSSTLLASPADPVSEMLGQQRGARRGDVGVGGGELRLGAGEVGPAHEQLPPEARERRAARPARSRPRPQRRILPAACRAVSRARTASGAPAVRAAGWRRVASSTAACCRARSSAEAAPLRTRASTTLNTRSAIARFSRAIARRPRKRQHLEIGARDTGHEREPHRLVIEAGGAKRRFGRAHAGGVASPQIDLVARAQGGARRIARRSSCPHPGAFRGARCLRRNSTPETAVAPAIRTCASAWRTCSAAIAMSGLALKAASISAGEFLRAETAPPVRVTAKPHPTAPDSAQAAGIRARAPADCRWSRRRPAKHGQAPERNASSHRHAFMITTNCTKLRRFYMSVVACITSPVPRWDRPAPPCAPACSRKRARSRTRSRRRAAPVRAST